MSSPNSPLFRGFDSLSPSSGGSNDADGTIVANNSSITGDIISPTNGQQQQHTFDGAKDASISQMCDIIVGLQTQMLQMKLQSEQRDAAMVERLLALDQRFNTTNDSKHSGAGSHREATLSDATNLPDASIAVGSCATTVYPNNNIAESNSNISSCVATTVNRNNNKAVYTQSTESDLATHTHTVTSGAVGPAHKSIYTHANAHLSAPLAAPPAYVQPAHVYTSAPWSAASNVGAPTFQTSASTKHANAHMYVHRPVSHPHTGYYTGVPQPMPPPPRPHYEEPWPVYGSSYGTGQQQMSAAYGVHRLENRRLLDLPPFTGLPEDWPKFNQAFLHTTEAYSYNDVENLLRLQKSLSGEAERAVESLLIHPAHVQQVMETLSDTFGHPDLLIRSQIERVRRLAQVHEAHMELLVPFANVVRNVATYLDAPTTQHHLANPILLEELVQKLPVSRRIDWAFVATQIRPYATVRDFSDWISNIARLVRHALPASTTTKSTVVQNNGAGRTNQKQQIIKRVMLNATNDISEGEHRFKCSYCKKGHDTERCYTFRRLSVNDRWKIVNERAWCYSCLSDGHILPGCSAKRKCAVDDCTLWHHTLLHERDNATHRQSFNDNAGVRKQQGESRQRRQNNVPKSSTQPKTSTHGGSTSAQVHEEPTDTIQQVYTIQERMSKSTLLFRVLPITLHANGRELQTYALFDEGSSVSLIDDRIADSLGLDGPLTNISMKWFGKQTTVLRSRKLTIGISGQSCVGRQYSMNVRTIRNLSLPTQTVEPDRLYESNPHLRDVPLESFTNAVPSVLIGLDNHHLSLPLEVKTSEDDYGLVAVRSKLGWSVYGSDGPEYQPRAMVFTIDGERDDEYELLNEIVRGFITSEEFGVRTPHALIESDDDIRARSILHRTTKRVGDRFEVGLLWRQDNIALPPSYDMALRRLVNVEARMRRDPAYAEQYVNQIQSYLAKGYARKLNPNELQRQDAREWYLPHFAVVNPNKPGKFRIVFDAAAKVRGESLNSALLSGPDDNMPLARLLLQFRLGEVGVCADIAEMFHQVRIRDEDQTAQRFLWRGGDSSTSPEVYAMTVMTFGATCSPAAAQHVKNVNADEFRNEFPDAVEAIHRRHYVDDYVASFATPEEAARVSLDVVEIHRRGGFTLRGFVSNNRAVLQALGVTTGPGDQVNLEPESTFEKILGMTWDTTDDTFCFRTKFNRVPQGVLDGTVRPTKRSILSTCMSVFDPFGLLANFMLSPKLMVQDLYRMGSDWDEPASDEVWQRWEVWRNEISRTQLLRVPRCPFHNVDSISDIQLHIYADASEAAFAAVAFWRITRGTEVDLSFVMGKVKVSPTQILSIPRLELNAAVLATRLLDEIRRSHDSIQINKVVMWTDSETVLKWLRSDQRKYKQYVGFRVAEIAASTPTSLWRWVPTSMNVADDGTRVRNPPVFDPNGRWLWGPAWLRDDESTWPKQRGDLNDAIEPCSEEVRPNYVGVTVIHQPFIKFTRFSSFTRLCRCAGWILRFRHNALCKKRSLQIKCGELTAGEFEEGLKLLCRTVQQEVYASEYSTLTRGNELNQTSSIFMLSPYLDDDGLMRLRGRTDAASDNYLEYDARRPIILPRQHHFTMIMVRYHHERLAHQLIEATIAAVRKRFWVPQVRVLVRNVQQACQKCRLRTASPEPPIQGQLPLDRLTPYVRPFASTGLDYFGPVMVRIGRRQEKRWVALFTCLAVRAVHLEIASNLSTDACLVCIRNLINLRGVPNLIRCDNGTNFVGAKNQLDKETAFFDSDAIQRELSTRGIEWKFNRPGNPEAGGAWERLVQSVKRVLAVTLQEATPEVETLRAHLIEAANIINSRPLTHIPVDPEDDDPLTPNHFLVGGSNLTTVPNPADIQSLSSPEQWVRCREMSRRFWCKWIRDYLPELTRRSRHYPTREPLRIGDLVIVCDDGQPRSRWIRGRIVETATGVDGLIRSAKVRTAGGEYWRPTTKLAVIDVIPPRMDSADGARDVAIC